MISGPGGVGKDTVAKLLCAEDDRFVLSRSWTTRAPRAGEGPDAYRFATRSEFEQHVADGGFLEWAEYHDNLYGTPVPDPDDKRNVVLVIEVQGARQILERFPDESFMILLEPPSEAVQAERLRGRGDDEAAVQRRVFAALEELADGRGIAHATVVNDDLATAVAQVRRILEGRLSEQ